MLMQMSELSSMSFLKRLSLRRNGRKGLAGGEGLRPFLGFNLDRGRKRVKSGLRTSRHWGLGVRCLGSVSWGRVTYRVSEREFKQ